MNTLTVDEKEVFQFVNGYFEEYGFSPSIRDIAHGCILAVPRVRQHLDTLQEKGYIIMTPSIARSIRILKRPGSGYTCRVCRREMPAGFQPVEACPYCGSFTGWWIQGSRRRHEVHV